MDGEIGTDAEVKKLVAAALAGQLTHELRRAGNVLAGLGHGLFSLVLLAASKRIAEQDSRIAELESKLHTGTLPFPARRDSRSWTMRIPRMIQKPMACGNTPEVS